MNKSITEELQLEIELSLENVINTLKNTGSVDDTCKELSISADTLTYFLQLFGYSIYDILNNLNAIEKRSIMKYGVNLCTQNFKYNLFQVRKDLCLLYDCADESLNNIIRLRVPEDKCKQNLYSLGFEDNIDFYLEDGGNRVLPNFISHSENLAIFLTGELTHRNQILSKFGKSKLDLQTIRNYYNICIKNNMQILVIPRKDFIDIMSKRYSLNDLIALYLWEPKYDVYVAGPFFNNEQLSNIEKIEDILASYNVNMFRPRIDAGKVDFKTCSPLDLANTFIDDVEGIANSRFILADITYKDTGTAFEIGYGYANNIPVILFNNEAVSGKKVNLMLAIPANVTFDDFDKLKLWLNDSIVASFNDRISNMEIE